MLMVIPFYPMILRVPGETVLLRAARMERDDLPTRTATLSGSQMVLLETFALPVGRSLSKKAQSDRESYFNASAPNPRTASSIEHFGTVLSWLRVESERSAWESRKREWR
jgi:hypothetical protein